MATLAPELPLSPELVLVSPPELAALARDLLPDPGVAATRPTVRARARSAGVAAFYVFCLANSLTPFVFAVAVGR